MHIQSSNYIMYMCKGSKYKNYPSDVTRIHYFNSQLIGPTYY